jgi:pimeloyl-ACP methyl ester carboxylesterase
MDYTNLGCTMSKRIFVVLILTFFWMAFGLGGYQRGLSQGAAEVVVLDRAGKPTERLTDGDAIRLGLRLPEAAPQAATVLFQLDGTLPVAECSLAQGQSSCQSASFASLGWYWDPGGLARPSRELSAGYSSVGGSSLARLAITVRPRPVVLVHGFASSWEAWARYVGPDGYLAGVGISGFAVGDGQVPGAMNTGQLGQPTGRTNTIAENAAILRDTVRAVEQLTGAQAVDLLAHSMGGLIARYAIDRYLDQGEVGQLIMLGSPMAGTECANLPASLGYYLPAALEIQPGYVLGVFNPQITRRKGAVFQALAGVPIVDVVQSPCTPVPTDLAVSLQSVSAIPLQLERVAVLHTDLNASERVFRDYVLPRLQTPAGEFPARAPDPTQPASAPNEALQFTRLFSGHLDQGESHELVIHIEPDVRVASFALYDSSRTLEVQVRGASGNEIQLDPQKNGLIRVEDPATLVYLGYGFKDPKPGAWRVTLLTGERTPASGADYALTATFQGGAQLQAQASALLPRPGEAVTLTARLTKDGQDLQVETALADVRNPDGSHTTIALQDGGGSWSASWTPRQVGLSYLQLSLSGRDPSGQPVERTGFLVVEAQRPPAGLRSLALLGGLLGLACLGGLALVLLGGIWWWRRRRK